MSYTIHCDLSRIVQKEPEYFFQGLTMYPEASIIIDESKMKSSFVEGLRYAISKGYVKIVMNKVEHPVSIEEAALRSDGNL